MPRTRHVVLCSLGLLLAAPAFAQELVVVGRVVGDDQAGIIPPDWVAKVSALYTDGVTVPPRDSDADIFFYRVRTNVSVRLVFSALGYKQKGTDYTVYSTDARHRPDIVLERINAQMALIRQGSPDTFSKALEDEAELARQTGTSDIFKANLSLYRNAVKARPDFGTRVEQFEASPVYKQMINSADNRFDLEPDVVARLALDRNTTLTPEQEQQLLDVAGDETVFPGIRTWALDRLSGRTLADDTTRALIKVAEGGATEPTSAVAIAARGTLARLGKAPTPSAAVGPQEAQISAEAFRWALMNVRAAPVSVSSKVRPQLSSDWWVNYSATATDPATKVIAVQGLATSTDKASTDALIRAVGPENPASVRLEAAKALAGRATNEVEVQKTLKTVAATDPSTEVRAAAASAAARTASTP